MPDDRGVADGIDLLEQIGDDDGKGEGEDGAPALPLCQLHRLEKRLKTFGMHMNSLDTIR